jgi:O-antigen/teichoic acid export membrane protein
MSAGVARQEMVGVMKAQVADRLATAALGIGVLLLGLGVVALGVAFLLGSVVGYLVARKAVRDLGIYLDLRKVDRHNLFPMLKRSLYIGLDTMVSQFLFRFDQVILSAMKGDAVLAAYSVAYRLLETVLFISWAIARALFPAMSAGGPERVKRGIEEGVAALAVVYVPFGVMLFLEADRIIPFLFGSDYGSASVEVARWLSVAPILFGISYLAGYGLQSLARSRDVLLASLSAAVFNIALNLILIPIYAGTGAAIATSAAYALESIVSLWMLAPAVGWPRVGRRLIAPVVASAVMAVVLSTIPGHVLLSLAVGGVVYLLCWYPLARRTAPEQISVVSSLIPGRSKR